MNTICLMTAATSMSVFHQWLLADSTSQSERWTIVIHGGESMPDDQLILDIADYLNEYDDESDGRWLPATQELVEKVSLDPNHRRLLHMEETGSSSADPGEEYFETLAAFARRGHVVLGAPPVDCGLDEMERVFHVSLDCGTKCRKSYHITLNPELIDVESIPLIVGDVFLGWQHGQMNRSNPIHRLH